MSFFDRAVDFFENVQGTPVYRDLLEEFVEFLNVTPEMAVVDVGCGPGVLTRLLAERVKSVSCIDLSPAMVERAREHAIEQDIKNASYAVGSAEAIPLENGYFDRAVATSVIYFLKDPVAALKEMARVVKKGGVVAMMNPADTMTGQNVIDYINKHALTGFNAEVLEDWLHAAEGARRLSEEYATKILSGAGLSDITNERYLDGMVLFSKAVKT